MRPEAKLQFDKAAAAFNLDDEARDRAWRRMNDLGLSPDDPTVVYLAVGGLLEKAADTLPAAIASLPAQVEAAARKAVGPVAQAASKRVEEAHANLAESTGAAVAESAGRYFDAEITNRRLKVTAVAFSMAIVVALLCGLAGYWIGAWSLANLDASIRALAGRDDIRTVLALLQGNSDLNASIGAYCGSGSDRVIVAEGLRNCSVPLWLDGRGTIAPVSQGSQPLVSMWSGGIGFLNRFHPVTLLAGGIALGLALPRLLRSIPGVKATA